MEGEKIRVYFTVPDEVIDCIERYRIQYAGRYKNNSKYFAELLPFYLSNPGYFGFDLTGEDIVRYQSMETTQRNNVSFYVSKELYAKIAKNAEEQMRTLKAEMLLFIFSLYKYFKSFHP